jgi:Reverse transcriptase (RNA-dependent DNA polymerase)
MLLFAWYLTAYQHRKAPSIIQGSAIGPTLYIIMESDLKSSSQFNIIFKYADDTNLLVPQHTDIQMDEEFEAIKLWASNNKMIINMAKTKEIVFRRPNPRLDIDITKPILGIEQVTEVKLLGVCFDSNLRFCSHLNFILKQCSQRSFLLKQLRCQGLSQKQLNTIFDAIIISRLRYALPAWAGFLSKESEGRIDAFLRRMFQYGYCCQCYCIRDLITYCDERVFQSVTQPLHCLNQLLVKKSVNISLRSRGHNYVLPFCVFQYYKNSFVNRCLFNYV